MKPTKNIMFFLFLPTFVILYVASNSHNVTLGMVGIGLVIISAVTTLLMK